RRAQYLVSGESAGRSGDSGTRERLARAIESVRCAGICGRGNRPWHSFDSGGRGVRGDHADVSEICAALGGNSGTAILECFGGDDVERAEPGVEWANQLAVVCGVPGGVWAGGGICNRTQHKYQYAAIAAAGATGGTAFPKRREPEYNSMRSTVCGRARGRSWGRGAAGLLLLCMAGCQPWGKPGAEEPAPDQITDFKTLYSTNCAGCHGTNGRNGPGRI